MSRLKCRFTVYIGGGGVLTFAGDRQNQAAYWELVSYDPDTETYGAPLGSLTKSVTKTGSNYLSTNSYVAPKTALGEGDNRYDVVRVKWAD